MSKMKFTGSKASNDGAKAPIEARMKDKILGAIFWAALMAITACLYVGCFGFLA
jgi:hypothetical protein